jgi:hypothetical protein
MLTTRHWLTSTPGLAPLFQRNFLAVAHFELQHSAKLHLMHRHPRTLQLEGAARPDDISIINDLGATPSSLPDRTIFRSALRDFSMVA